MQGPNANVFVSQWNIGFNEIITEISATHSYNPSLNLTDFPAHSYSIVFSITQSIKVSSQWYFQELQDNKKTNFYSVYIRQYREGLWGVPPPQPTPIHTHVRNTHTFG